MRHFSRQAFLPSLAAMLLMPVAALADRQADKRKFLAQCDESISLDRLAGAPHKFVGKKVDIHGTVGPAMEDTQSFNLDSDNAFIIVIGDARTLEQGQAVRVLGTVQNPISGTTTTGGNGVFAVVQASFIA